MDETPRSRFPPTRANVNYYAPAYKQHAAFWYEDATVILVAQDIVRVSGSADDFACLLHQIYHGRRSYLAEQEPDIPCSVLSALMRRGRAYEMTALVHEAAEYLRVAFTNDCDGWLEGVEDGLRDLRFGFEPGEALVIEAVYLARLTGQSDWLPVALFRCCQFPVETLVDGARRRDGVTVRLGVEGVLETDRRVLRRFRGPRWRAAAPPEFPAGSAGRRRRRRVRMRSWPL